MLLAASLETGTYTVNARVTDESGKYQIQYFLIEVTNADRPPSDISLSHLSVAENKSAGTIIGTLSASDPDGDSVRFALPVASKGQYDNVGFKIDSNNNLLSSGLIHFDYESKESLNILVRATDSTGLVMEKAFQISVTDVNEPPYWKLDRTTFEIEENGDSNEVLGTLRAIDPEGETVTYRVEGNGSPFDNNGNELVATSSFDRESQDSYTVAVVASDGVLENHTTIQASILDVDEKPTNLDIDNGSISSDAPIGAVVGIVSAKDPEGEFLTYEAYDPAGKEYPFPLTMDGNKLVVNGLLSGDSLNVRLAARDTGGNSLVSDFAITIIQATEPPALAGPSFWSHNEGSDQTITLQSSYDGTGKVFYFLEGGKDSESFSVDSTSGVLSFNSIPDYEKPTDIDEDNTYEITVFLEADGLSASFDRNVTVIDVFEPPLPFADNEMGASLSFEKGLVNLEWENPEDGNYVLTLNDGDRSLYYGGHPIENAQVDHKFFDLLGTEILDGSFAKYSEDGSWEASYKAFTLDLSFYSVIIDSQTESGEYMQFTWDNPPSGGTTYQLSLEDNQGNSLISGNHESGRATFDYISAGIPPGTRLKGIFGLVPEGEPLGSFQATSSTQGASSVFYVLVPSYGTDKNVLENATSVGVFSSVTSVSDELDGDLFSLNSSSFELSFLEAPDYENPKDGNSDNTYELILHASGGTKLFLSVHVGNVDETLVLPSDLSERLVISLAEGNRGTLPLSLDLQDPEGREIEFSISGGVDSQNFELDAENLSFFLRKILLTMKTHQMRIQITLIMFNYQQVMEVM